MQKTRNTVAVQMKDEASNGKDSVSVMKFLTEFSKPVTHHVFTKVPPSGTFENS